MSAGDEEFRGVGRPSVFKPFLRFTGSALIFGRVRAKAVFSEAGHPPGVDNDDQPQAPAPSHSLVIRAVTPPYAAWPAQPTTWFQAEEPSQTCIYVPLLVVVNGVLKNCATSHASTRLLEKGRPFLSSPRPMNYMIVALRPVVIIQTGAV
ncbi:uncharacterized protein LACBIDRAFT_312960 [Laccaria bicolor S238N-H82]|uniref:Predicted protein n=1 Tax=Laccaria bicolor (strain S238N-H82 / ATCC MYA-4686) TaxID=486041 RepID=B0DX77_LACBS|nr:uncharacterized protein LACBIDRAFT_312960 [Laccaria bicolor S238N-H82]EDR00787.1 predicted protein [Laccaria bicolor S238N-H82]|eukprot:XP_001888579.1 predicted protein [Laccaria bicolor S238N-H82]